MIEQISVAECITTMFRSDHGVIEEARYRMSVDAHKMQI